MQGNRAPALLRSKPGSFGTKQRNPKRGAARYPRQDDAVSRAIVALHSATDAEGVFAAMRRFLRDEVSFAFIAFLLRGRERERDTFLRCAGQPRPSDIELRAMFERADELRKRKRRKLIQLTDSADGLGTGSQTKGGRSRAYSALVLGFDGCGYAQASLLIARAATNNEVHSRELETLERLRLHVVTALRGVRTLQRERVTRLALQKLLSRFPVGIVLLDWEERTLYRNATAAELCAHWNYGAAGRSLNARRVFRVPKEVVLACRSLDPTVNSGGFTEATVSSPTKPYVRAVVRSVRFEAQLLGRPRYLIHFEAVGGKREPHAGPTRMDLLLRLTPRERELAEVVSRGVSNAAAARKLGKSVYTVKKQLQGVYRKLGVKNRARLVAILSR